MRVEKWRGVGRVLVQRDRKGRIKTWRLAKGISAKDLEKARRVHAKRSKRARTLDAKRTAKRIAKRLATWLRNPGRYDLPGVDTAPMVLEVERRKSDKGLKVRSLKFLRRGAVIEERRLRDYAYISLAQVKRDVDFIWTARAVGVKNLRTGEVVWLPSKLARVRKTYIAIPWWLYREKVEDFRKAGFTLKTK